MSSRRPGCVASQRGKGPECRKATPRDLISTLQSIKAAGALQVDLEVYKEFKKMEGMPINKIGKAPEEDSLGNDLGNRKIDREKLKRDYLDFEALFLAGC